MVNFSGKMRNGLTMIFYIPRLLSLGLLSSGAFVAGDFVMPSCIRYMHIRKCTQQHILMINANAVSVRALKSDI